MAAFFTETFDFAGGLETDGDWGSNLQNDEVTCSDTGDGYCYPESNDSHKYCIAGGVSPTSDDYYIQVSGQ